MNALQQLPESSDWTFEYLYQYADAIENIAKNTFHLDTFPIQLEVISAEPIFSDKTLHRSNRLNMLMK